MATNFKEKLRQLLNQAQQQAQTLTTGEPLSTAAPVPLGDVLQATQSVVPHPQGLVENLQNIGKRRSTARIQQRESTIADEERALKAGKTRAETAYLGAGAEQREAATRNLQVRTVAEELKNQNLKALDDAKLVNLNAQTKSVLAEAERRLAEASKAYEESKVTGNIAQSLIDLRNAQAASEAAQAAYDNQRAELAERETRVREKGVDLKKRELEEVDIPGSAALRRNRDAATERIIGLMSGQTPEGQGKIDLLKSQTGATDELTRSRKAGTARTEGLTTGTTPEGQSIIDLRKANAGRAAADTERLRALSDPEKAVLQNAIALERLGRSEAATQYLEDAQRDGRLNENLTVREPGFLERAARFLLGGSAAPPAPPRPGAPRQIPRPQTTPAPVPRGTEKLGPGEMIQKLKDGTTWVLRDLGNGQFEKVRQVQEP